MVAKTVAEMAAYGLEARHLRAFRSAADREVGLVEQVVAPLAKQRNPEARHGPTRSSASWPRCRCGCTPPWSRPALGVGRAPLATAVGMVDGVQPLDVVGVRVEMPSNQPIVLLREIAGERYLPIWIGAVEATAIAFAQQGVVPARPMTHDLLRDVLAALGVELVQIRITELRDGVFYALLVFASGVEVSARPSDAIALALRTGTPIFGAEDVLDEAGIVIADEQEDEVERFLEFLDQISPEDFGAEGSGRLATSRLTGGRRSRPRVETSGPACRRRPR